MSTKGLRYSELNSEAQETALRSFIKFYVHQYLDDSLEILGAHVSNGVMATINQILRENSFMGPAELNTLSYRLSKAAYVEILNQLDDVFFNPDGAPVVDWKLAWEEKEEKLPEED